MSSIAFLEVEADDRAQVQAAYSESLILEGKLQDADVLEQCKETEVLSCFIYSKIQEKELDLLPNLTLIVTRSVGFDHVDLDACKKRNITVCNVPDYGSHVIAEHVFALLLSALRHITEADERVEGGTFDYQGLRGMALRGKTLGILGTGKIGRRVAQIAHGFGMKIVAYDVCRVTELTDLLDVEYVPLDELFRRSDIITLHLPALKETEHIINAEAFEKMREGVVLVNTARGALIDSTALLQALKSGKVSHALLDVLEHEKNFEENEELIEHPNVVSTPHIAFYADDSMRNMYIDCFESIDQFRRGKTPEHTVKPPTIVCDLPHT
ncbi:hypothetical protein COU76_03100 [Candidatus Peregrinibacteria bacterium CG10_big_fil_rev_8_21_14_0_10_49_10]|nr:MAG: hypothetical protein COU76_03100 [Candidatus Peregrinibacteria bacterium CG10_big_fil_rev_8_21_14_0_10_49_10]